MYFGKDANTSSCANKGYDYSSVWRTYPPGDVWVVGRLDRLGRSMVHLVSLIETLREKDVGSKSLCDGAIDTTTTSVGLVFNLFSSMAQFEQRLIPERTHGGIVAVDAKVNVLKIQTAFWRPFSPSSSTKSCDQ
ncbi:recombinase family protein [Legionella sp. 29fVS95]|uniref:recombinase family protein n=1 Tax=Legionella sp. 29fVS95 TaxID=3402813 RepID=UPI003AF4A226